MENGRLSAEEIRREKRRQKILLNSNDRMKKIISGSSGTANYRIIFNLSYYIQVIREYS